MREICLDNLPKRGRHGQINWSNTVGCVCKFTYDDTRGEVKIVGYKNNYVKFKYNDEYFTIICDDFKKCMFGRIVNTKKFQYAFSVGDTIHNQQVLTLLRGDNGEKSYEVMCRVCGNINVSSESHLKRCRSCPVCANKVVVKGINDIATTHPYIIDFIKNKDDANNYTYGSGKKIEFICPICGTSNKRIIQDVISNGFNCKKCGDGVSLPNKLIFNILHQLNVVYDTEVIFKWANGKKYDFLVGNIIIEAHGRQHYERTNRGRTLEEEQSNDKLKRELALSNGIKHYIELDCRKSELEWIKNSIMNSELPNLLNFKEEDIDWIDGMKYAYSSRLKDVCDMWNHGVRSAIEISKVSKIPHYSVWRYLKQGSKIGICDYDPSISLKEGAVKSSKYARKLIAVYKNDKKIGEFESASWIDRNSIELFGEKMDTSHICAVCRGELRKHKGYSFKYI